MGGVGIIECMNKEIRSEPYSQYIVNYIKNDKDFMDGIRRGLSDLREGRIQPWSEVKEELGIE